MTPGFWSRKPYMGTQTLVLGATGFLGRWVARALCAQGADVSLVVRHRVMAEKIFPLYAIQGNIFVLDLLDLKAVLKVLQDIQPSIVFNLAGYGVKRSEREANLAYQINAHLVETLCEELSRRRDSSWSGQDIVHVGSGAEYGTIGGDLSEDSTPQPTSLYGKSKLAGTHALVRLCKAHNIKGLTARPFTVYGPGEPRGRLVPTLLEAARTQQVVRLTSGEQHRDFTYVEDVAEGLLRLGVVQTAPGDIVNLATGQLTSVRRFVVAAARVLAIPGHRLQFGTLPLHTEEMEHSEVSLARLRNLLGWVPPTSPVEGIRRTKDFEQASGMGEM